MGPLDVFLRVSFAGFAAILATVSVQPYARHRERRFLLLTAAFAFFLIQGLWLLVEMATTAVSSIGSGWLPPKLGGPVPLFLPLVRGLGVGRALTSGPAYGITPPGPQTRAAPAAGA